MRLSSCVALCVIYCYMASLKETLINTALAKGICNEGYRKMRRLQTKEEMAEYYLVNPDWCMERDFPTLKMLREHFADVRNMGVFVDHTFHGELLNDLQAYAFHNCRGTIRVGLNVDEAIIPMLYFANNCRMRIVGVGDVVLPPALRTRVPLYIFGDNSISARDNKHVVFRFFQNKLL